MNLQNLTRTSFILLIAIAVCLSAGTSHAQALLGTAGNGWQTWGVADLQFVPSFDLNTGTTSGPASPYWNAESGASQPNDEGYPAEKNVGFCLTSTGDCQGIGSALIAPGTLSFWGAPFTSTPDGVTPPSGGARDNHVIFRNSGTLTRSGFRWQSYRATLYLNSSANPLEINEFGWFETNSTGTANGTKHALFQGSGEPHGSITPSAVGSTATFTPTQYFGYYYSDVSEPACPDGTDCGDPNAVLHGCYAYTVFSFNDPRCLDAYGQQGDHDFAIFATNPGSSRTTYWIAGEDPADCPGNDGDCNLTLIKVSPVGSN